MSPPRFDGWSWSYLYYSGHGDLAAEANASGSVTSAHSHDAWGAPGDTPPANHLIGMVVGAFAKRHRVLTERLTADAMHDFLTGLLNRRSFDAALARRLAAGLPFALLFADADGLKRVNDLEGHAAGDAVLIRAGRLLAASLRSDDEIARLGGDEFAVVASLAGADTAEKLCHALEASLADRGVALSIGWALFPADGADADSLFGQADVRLYDRKRRPGRLTPPALPNSSAPASGLALPVRALAQ